MNYRMHLEVLDGKNEEALRKKFLDSIYQPMWNDNRWPEAFLRVYSVTDRKDAFPLTVVTAEVPMPPSKKPYVN